MIHTYFILSYVSIFILNIIELYSINNLLSHEANTLKSCDGFFIFVMLSVSPDMSINVRLLAIYITLLKLLQKLQINIPHS